jgi:hypothetical protein
MSEPPLNVEYWASLYRVYEEDNEQYAKALEEPELVDRARQLWQWKDLSRSIDFEEVAPVIEEFEVDDYLNQNPATAVREVRDILQQEGIIKGRGLVTPAFLLHLASSGPNGSSAEFPIYDRRVWNAYVYLWGIREKDERLYTAASQSPDQYANLCYDFRDSCPDDNPRRYEQALFMFGGFIMDLASNGSPTSIETIDTVVSTQEAALRQMQNEAGYAMVDISDLQRE